MDKIAESIKKPSKSKSFPIQNVHASYAKRCHAWKVVRDCVEGSDTIKAAGQTYLPMASGRDREEREARYRAYKQRAVFVNFTGQALEFMHGLIFRRCPSITTGTALITNGLTANVDRKGRSLYQFASDTTYDVMQTGFGGYLLDMPPANGVTNQAEAEKVGIRPYIKYYTAENVCWWDYREINGAEQLCTVVLKEQVCVTSEDFMHSYEDHYRVLRLDKVTGEYYQTLYTPVFNEKGEIDKYDTVDVEITVQGEKIYYLPFVMLPYEEPEKPMLYDMALMNIAHYQSTADYKNGVRMTTIPTGYITGYTERDEEDGDEITLGGDTFLTEANPDAKFGTLVFSGEGLSHAEKDIEKIESQIAGLFIKDLAPEKKASETAEAAYVHRAGENAKLATFARNMSIKLTKIMQMYQEWNGLDPDVEIELNYDYETMALDPNIINSIANISGQGKMPMYCVFWILKNQELIEPNMDYEDFIFLIDLETTGASAQEVYKMFLEKRKGDNKLITAR